MLGADSIVEDHWIVWVNAKRVAGNRPETLAERWGRRRECNRSSERIAAGRRYRSDCCKHIRFFRVAIGQLHRRTEVDVTKSTVVLKRLEFIDGHLSIRPANR